jgi:hypothetical protein
MADDLDHGSKILTCCFPVVKKQCQKRRFPQVVTALLMVCFKGDGRGLFTPVKSTQKRIYCSWGYENLKTGPPPNKININLF